jgi:transcription elongation factor GreA
MSECPMTLLGKKLLEDELSNLIRVEREEIKRAISDARELGDLKENAEYHAAKERQSIIEGRILDVQSKIARGRVVNTSLLNTDKIVFGATVTVLDIEKNTQMKFQIVGEDEAMTDPKKISYSSPLGKALIGKEVSDEVVVKAPKGDISYEVQEIEYF